MLVEEGKNVAINITTENSTILIVIVYAKVNYNNSKMQNTLSDPCKS